MPHRNKRWKATAALHPGQCTSAAPRAQSNPGLPAEECPGLGVPGLFRGNICHGIWSHGLRSFQRQEQGKQIKTATKGSPSQGAARCRPRGFPNRAARLPWHRALLVPCFLSLLPLLRRLHPRSVVPRCRRWFPGSVRSDIEDHSPGCLGPGARSSCRRSPMSSVTWHR